MGQDQYTFRRCKSCACAPPGLSFECAGLRDRARQTRRDTTMRSMIREAAACVLPALLLAACAATGELPPAGAENADMHYRCAGGAEVDAHYYRDDHGRHWARVDFGDRSVVMVNVRAGSGARYRNGPDIWWTKGPTAFLEHDGKPVLQDCRAVAARH